MFLRIVMLVCLALTKTCLHACPASTADGSFELLDALQHVTLVEATIISPGSCAPSVFCVCEFVSRHRGHVISEEAAVLVSVEQFGIGLPAHAIPSIIDDRR
jgi:hypothetical protein